MVASKNTSTSDTNSAMATFLREARERAGLRQKDVAHELGYGTSQFVSNWERGLRQPSCQTLWKLAELYGVDAESLYSMMLEETIARVDRELRAEFLGSKPRAIKAPRANSGRK